MTVQGVFTLVCNHMLEQNERSLRDGPQGAYYGHGDLRCPVGFLIPEEYYFDELENKPVNHPDVISALPFAVSGELLSILESCQEIHDNEPPDCWLDHLISLSVDWDLDAPSGQYR